MSADFLNAGAVLSASMNAPGGLGDSINLEGHYDIVCTDAEGNVLWENGFDNLVTTVGMNQLLASGVFGSEPAFLGLIGGSGTVVAITDTLTTHPGWVEAGGAVNPVYGTTRPGLGFVAPSAGATSASGNASFVFTSSGSVNGGFVVFGSSASATVDSTTGVLLSAGTLTTPQPVISTNTVTMTYTLTL
jgi:hypothetical protein